MQDEFSTMGKELNSFELAMQPPYFYYLSAFSRARQQSWNSRDFPPYCERSKARYVRFVIIETKSIAKNKEIESALWACNVAENLASSSSAEGRPEEKFLYD